MVGRGEEGVGRKGGGQGEYGIGKKDGGEGRGTTVKKKNIPNPVVSIVRPM